jgi:hypothetical protein
VAEQRRTLRSGGSAAAAPLGSRLARRSPKSTGWRRARSDVASPPPTPPEPPRSSRRPGAPSRSRLEAPRRTRSRPQPPTAASCQPPAPDARHEKRPSAASGREVLSVQAAAAAEEVERLEAAYQHAFTAIETLVAAIERVHQLRRQQRPWEQANKLGVAVKRPEPWHVRTAHDIELRQLNKRFIQVVNSSW